MSLLNLAWRVLAAVTLMVAAPTVMGQVYHPFADPLEFDPDWQFFAPVDVDSLAELSPRKRANEGWFATYDRTYLRTSRPHTEDSAANSDFGWGNRFDLGLMTEKDNGWLFSFRSMGGPNVYDIIFQERINRFNATDTSDPANPLFPSADRNDPQLRERAYLLADSLNVFGLTNFEVNKTFRFTPYRYGGILEPMIGFKYATIKDFAMNQSYFRSQEQITTPGGALTATTQQEVLTSLETSTQNQMVGGQLGARYFTHYNRWTLSAEFRGFAMQNFQQSQFAQRNYITQYTGAPATGVGVTATDYTTGSGVVHTSNNEFVFGFEARAEAAYQVTKYINVRGGLDVLDFASGIWRGANPTTFGNNLLIPPNVQTLQDQDVQIAGFTFGLTLNR